MAFITETASVFFVRDANIPIQGVEKDFWCGIQNKHVYMLLYMLYFYPSICGFSFFPSNIKSFIIFEKNIIRNILNRR